MPFLREKLTSNLSYISLSIISLFPVIIFLGSGILNFSIILLDILFISEILLKKNFKYFNNKFFYSFIFCWLILLINLNFSISFYDSLPRSLGFLRFIFFVFAINYYLFETSNKYVNLIFKFWTIVFVIISVDLIYEYFVGVNTLGFKSYMPGRLSGFFNQELKIGHLYSAFILICLSSIYLHLKDLKLKKINLSFDFIKNNIFYLILILFLFISIIIGERSNFIKTFIMTIMFLFIFEKKNILKKTTSIIIGLFIIFFIIINNADYKERFWRTFLLPLITDPINSVLDSHYGNHYEVAIEVYKNHKLMGVGLKNYRKEVVKEQYPNNASIHPHQIHLELLSETGIVGYISFLFLFFYHLFFSISNYMRKKNIYQLSGILFVIVSLIPIIPSGSFFTTYGAALFWLNFGLMLPKK